jgi:hypothetical protein
MTDDEIDFAQRLAAHPRWQWMNGMLGHDTGLRLDEFTAEWEAKIPDLADPATWGPLLVILMSEGRVSINTARDSGGSIRTRHGAFGFDGPEDIGFAIARALLAAWDVAA